MSENSFFRHSPARTSSATVFVGCTSFRISGSAFISDTIAELREKSSFFNRSKRTCGAMRLSPLDKREGEIRCRQLKGDALADQPGELCRVPGSVEARDDATRAVPEHERRQRRFARSRQFDERGNVAHIVAELLDIESLAVRFAPTTQIERVDGETACRELLCSLCVVTAVRVDAMDDDGNATGRLRRPPLTAPELETAGPRSARSRPGLQLPTRRGCRRDFPPDPRVPGARRWRSGRPATAVSERSARSSRRSPATRFRRDGCRRAHGWR